MINKFSFNNFVGFSIIGIQAIACIYLYKNRKFPVVPPENHNKKIIEIVEKNNFLRNEIDSLKSELNSLKSELNSLKSEVIVPLIEENVIIKASDSSTITWFIDQAALYSPQILFCTLMFLALVYSGEE